MWEKNRDNPADLKEEAPSLKEMPPESQPQEEESSYWARIPTKGSAPAGSDGKTMPGATPFVGAAAKQASADSQSGAKKSAPNSKWKLIRFALICTVLALVNMLFFLRGEFDKMKDACFHPPPSSNQLAIGKGTAAGPIYVAVKPLPELDGKKVSEVLSLRESAVAEHKDLLPKYEPYLSVWKIADGKPWWGVKGFSFYGQGNRSMEGASVHGEEVVNPFLLASLNFNSRPDWTPQAMQSAGDDPNFPYFPRPEQLKWFPAERRTEVTYDMTKWAAEVSKVNGAPFDPRGMGYDVLTVNAHDMGYNWVAILDASGGAGAKSQGGLNWQFLGNGKGAGLSCNNIFCSMSGSELRSFPADLQVRFWRDKPKDYFKTPPDLTAIIHLK